MDRPYGSTRDVNHRERRAVVRLDGHRVGELSEITEGDARFVYDAEWLASPEAVPISLTLPLRAEPYDAHGLHPFFENLLPEGWLLQLSTAKLKIPSDDAFGLLIATCADCVGAIEVAAIETVAIEIVAVENVEAESGDR